MEEVPQQHFGDEDEIYPEEAQNQRDESPNYLFQSLMNIRKNAKREASLRKMDQNRRFTRVKSKVTKNIGVVNKTNDKKM